MHKISYWASPAPISVSHCFTSTNLAHQARWRQIQRQRDKSLGLRPNQSLRGSEHPFVFYLSPSRLEAGHQIRAISELLVNAK